MLRAMRTGCWLIALALAGSFAWLMYGAHQRGPFVPHRIRTLDELQERTAFRWPVGTELVEATYEIVPGETIYYAVLRMPPATAIARLKERPFKAATASRRESWLRQPMHAPLASWHAEEARSFVANEAQYGTPPPPGSTPDVHPGFHLHALVGMDEMGTATVYAYWVKEYG